MSGREGQSDASCSHNIGGFDCRSSLLRSWRDAWRYKRRPETDAPRKHNGSSALICSQLLPLRCDLVIKDNDKTSDTMKPNPIIQSLFMGGFGSKVDGISLMQVHPLDPYTLINVQPSNPPVAQPKPARILSSAARRNSNRTRQRPAFTAEETRHHYAIEALEKPGPFRPQPYLYTCVRCRWIFRVNDSRGSIIGLDGLGRRLPEPENAKRIVTFHRGPCPAFPVLEYLVPEPHQNITLVALVGFLSRVARAFGIPIRGRLGNRRYPKAAAS